MPDSIHEDLPGTVEEGFGWTSFEALPVEIEGCGCYFTEENKNSFNYIFADATGQGIILVAGDTLYLDRIDDPIESDSVDEYSNGAFTLRVLITSSKPASDSEESETNLVKGILTLTRGDKQEQRAFSGYCGC